MYKRFFAVILCMAMLAACANKEPETPMDDTETEQSSNGTVEDWFPFLPDTLIEYEGNGTTESANYRVYNGFIEGNSVQRRVWTDDRVATELMVVKDGKLSLCFGNPEYYYFNKLIGRAALTDMVLLQEPFAVGQTWTVTEGVEGEVIGMDVPIETPSGNYDTMEVTITSNGVSEKYYYAKGVGLVKTIYQSSVGEVISTLSNVRKNASLEIPVAVYLPNITTNEVEKFERTFTMQTNTDFAALLEEEMKNVPSEDYAPLLTANTKIQDIAFDWSKDTATVDLSAEYLAEINVGDGIQNNILQCIADTVGQFYDIQSVMITVDAEPFNNGSVALNEDEPLKATGVEATYHEEQQDDGQPSVPQK